MRARTITALAAAVTATAAAVIPVSSAFADTPVPAASTGTPAARTAAVPEHHAGLWMAWAGTGKYWVGSVTVRENGKTVIADCVIPGAALVTPTSVRNGTYGSERETAELSYVMYAWGTSSSDSVAAGARLAMLRIVGRPIPGLQVPAKIAGYATADVLNARRYAGKDTGAVVFGDKPTTPGQASGSVKMDIVSAEHFRVTGVPVRFTAVSASLSAAGRSGEWKAFTRTSPAGVRVKGTAVVASPDEVTIGTAPHAQTLISALPARVSASASYQNHPGGVKSTVACNCDGTGNVTGTVSQAAGAAEGQYTLWVSGQARTTVTVPAGRHTAGLKAADVADGSVVTFTARYRVDGRWTAPVRLGGSFTVHCPVMPRVSFTSQCNCIAGTAGYADKAVVTVVNPSAAYTDTVSYTVDGVRHALTVAPGASKSDSLAVPAGTVSFGWSWAASV